MKIDGEFAFNKHTREILKCGGRISCKDCIFNEWNCTGNNKIKWLYKEYEEPILSDDEFDLIKNIGRIKNKRYKYVVRTKSGEISLFVDKPTVLEDDFGRYCSSKRYFSVLDSEKILFQNIRYEDGIYDIENKTFIKQEINNKK